MRARCRPWRLGVPEPHVPAPLSPGLARARRWLRRRGYAVRVQPDGGLHAGRGRFSALGSPLFHLSILLAAAGALLESAWGFSGTAVVNAGQAFYGEPGEYFSAPRERLELAPRLSFKVRTIRPRYHGDELFFTELVAEVESPVGPDAEAREVRLSGSEALGEGLVTLTGYGYSLEYVLSSQAGERLEEGLATLSIFPPGQKDSLRLPGWPYDLFIELFPNFVVDGAGNPASKGMALGDVRVGLTVLRNRAVLAKQVVRLGEGVRFDNLELRPTRVVPQGQFRVRHSPGVPVLGTAFVLMAAGLALRLLWSRREVLVAGSPEQAPALTLDGEWPLAAAADLRHALRGGGSAP